MTALVRRPDAAILPAVPRSSNPQDLWHDAARLRQEWLSCGLSGAPADRRTAEESLAAIYARLSRPRPRFVWVDSPHAALRHVVGLPTLDDVYRWIRDPRQRGAPPLASDLALLSSRLRAGLSSGVGHADPDLSPARRAKGKDREPWPDLPAGAALAAGVPPGVVLHRGIRVMLHRSLMLGFAVPIRTLLARGGPVPVCWYGQQDASWIGYYDILHRLGLARYAPDAATHLGEWAALARSCGWWWPGEEVCVVTERPELAEVVPVPGIPGNRHGEVRLRPGGVRYRDGWHPRLG